MVDLEISDTNHSGILKGHLKFTPKKLQHLGALYKHYNQFNKSKICFSYPLNISNLNITTKYTKKHQGFIPFRLNLEEYLHHHLS